MRSLESAPGNSDAATINANYAMAHSSWEDDIAFPRRIRHFAKTIMAFTTCFHCCCHRVNKYIHIELHRILAATFFYRNHSTRRCTSLNDSGHSVVKNIPYKVGWKKTQVNATLINVSVSWNSVTCSWWMYVRHIESPCRILCTFASERWNAWNLK